MHPIVHISINGKPVTGVLLARLLSVTVNDKEGDSSDTITIELDAGFPLVSIPRAKDIIRCWIGYAEHLVPVDMGTYQVDDVTLHCYPHKLTIEGKSADVRGKIKEHTERHWDGSDFGRVAKDLASEAGLKAQVADSIASFAGKDGYFAIECESPMHYLRRMSKRLGGQMTIKNGLVLINESGGGKTPGGTAMGSLVITPPMHVKGSMSVNFSYREQYKEVRAPYHDTAAAERKFETAPGNATADAVHTIRHQFANKDEAKRAAESKARQLQRDADTTSVKLEGNPNARGGGPFSYAGFHPEIDGLPWIIETATHRVEKGGGYTTDIDAKAPGTSGAGGAAA